MERQPEGCPRHHPHNQRQGQALPLLVLQLLKGKETTAAQPQVRCTWQLSISLCRYRFWQLHIHNHIIYNSTSIDFSRKFNNFFLSGLAIQKLSDRVCAEYGLSIITPKPYRERQKRTVFLKKRTQRAELCEAIDSVLKEKPNSFEGLRRIKGGSRHAPEQKQFHLLIDIQSKKAAEKRMVEIGALQTHINNYSKIRKTCEAYRKSGYSKKFFEEHRDELMLHKAAKKASDQLEGKRFLPVRLCMRNLTGH